MNKKQTEDYLLKYIDPYLSQKGFRHKKSERTQIEYYLKTEDNTFVKFSLSTINYHDSHLLRFGFGKRIGAIEDIMTQINEKIPFGNPKYQKNSTSLGFSYNSFHGIYKDGSFDFMENEQQVKENVEKIIDFSESEAFPFLKKLDDLRELDRSINGQGENFWETDWKKPFNLAGRFVFRRLIIAKLNGRDDYEEFVQKIQNIANERASKNKKVLDWDNLSLPVPYTLHFLKNVESLY